MDSVPQGRVSRDSGGLHGVNERRVGNGSDNETGPVRRVRGERWEVWRRTDSGGKLFETTIGCSELTHKEGPPRRD